MAQEDIPRSWIGQRVRLETESGGQRAINATLLGVGSDGIVVKYTVHDDRGGGTDHHALYPWTSVYRLLKVEDGPQDAGSGDLVDLEGV